MKKHCCSLLVVLLSCLLASCGDDDYRYPSVKQDFLTAFSGMDGRLESVLADEGERLRIVEGASGLRVSADTAVRIVANYETLAIGDGDVAGAKLYALLQTVSPVPLAAAEFEEGVKTEPSLSKNRAEALAAYAQKDTEVDASLWHVTGVGEDWEGLRKEVEKHPQLLKINDVLRIIDECDGDKDLCEQRIRNLVPPEIYQRLLNEMYGPLRPLA